MGTCIFQSCQTFQQKSALLHAWPWSVPARLRVLPNPPQLRHCQLPPCNKNIQRPLEVLASGLYRTRCCGRVCVRLHLPTTLGQNPEIKFIGDFHEQKSQKVKLILSAQHSREEEIEFMNAVTLASDQHLCNMTFSNSSAISSAEKT